MKSLVSLLSKKDLEHIQKNSSAIKFKKNQVLFHDGDRCAGFVFVQEGSIRVQKVGESGRQISLYEVGKYEMCIMTSVCMIGTAGHKAEAVSTTSGVALVLPKEQFHLLFEQSTTFRNYVYQLMSEKMAALIMKIDEVTFAKFSTRLARVLVEKRDSENLVKLSHQQLADELGSAREVVSRQLKEFEKSGWVKVGRKHIELLEKSFKDGLL